MEARMKQKFQINRKENERKFACKILTLTMNPPRCLTQKGQKLNQFASSWTPGSKATLD